MGRGKPRIIFPNTYDDRKGLCNPSSTVGNAMNEPSESFEKEYELRRETAALEVGEELPSPDAGVSQRAEIGVAGRRKRRGASFNWAAMASDDRTLADRAYAVIYAAIINGRFGPGERLRIEDLSALLQISPTPIREALNRLEAAGLAEHLPHRGSRVSMVSACEFRELYELRLILEPLAMSKAAEKFAAEEAATAQDLLDRMGATLRKNEMPEAWDAHTAFHFTFYRAARWRWLERLIVPLWDSCRRYRLQKNNLRANLIQNQREHENILKACIAHDPELASRVIYNHVARNANVIALGMFGETFFRLQS
jgi:DNA-binding GntR family transcriptional regulator